MASYDQLEQALRAAMNQGNKPLARALAQKIKDKEYDIESGAGTIFEGGVASALQGFGQGATLGFGDEIAAGLRAGVLDPLVSSAFGGDIGGVGGEDQSVWESTKDYFTGMGERYDRALESQREAVEVARRENPYITTGAEVLGGLGTAGAGGAGVTAGRGLAAGAARLAGAGAGTGAAAGYGYSEGDPLIAYMRDKSDEEISKELAQAGRDVGVGAGLGGALGFATPFAGAAIRKVGATILKPFTKNARLNEEGRRRVVEALEADARAGNMTPQQIVDEIDRIPGMKIADFGPATRELTEEVAQTPTIGGRQVREALEERQKEQWQRISPRLSRALGQETDSFNSASRQLSAKMKDEAAANYGVAYQTPVRMTGRMREILDTPSGKLALKEGKALRGELEKNPGAFDIKGAMQSTRDLDYMIQAYDDVVTQLFKAGRNKRAYAAKELRDELKEAVYKANPDYREARAVWAGDMANANAMDQGLDIFKVDSDVVSELVGDMSQSELAHYKMGVLRAITRKLGNKSDTADVTKGIFDSPNKRDAVRAAFGSDQKFREFMQFISDEQKLFNTYKQATGNSVTARRLQQADGVVEKLGGMLGFAGTGSLLISGLSRRLAGMIPGAARRGAAREASRRTAQAGYLMGEGTEALENLMRPQTLGGLLGTGVPETAAMAPGAALPGLLGERSQD